VQALGISTGCHFPQKRAVRAPKSRVYPISDTMVFLHLWIVRSGQPPVPENRRTAAGLLELSRVGSGLSRKEPLAFAGGREGMLEMRIVTGLYDTYDQAVRVVGDLEDVGISSSDISIVAPDGGGQGEVNDASATVAGASVGAAVGGVGGLIAELGSFALPGIGPVVGAGWLVTTLIGAATGGAVGGILGSLTDAGVEESDAHFYAEGIRRGSALVIARVETSQADAAQSILGPSFDAAALRREF
jgi:hypothetical protein